MTKHHVIITGTGRTGTTLLVDLLTNLGFDTGFSTPDEAMFPRARAGKEFDIRRPDAPYIVKGPGLSFDLDNLLETRDIVVDHVLIPIRDLYSVAQSRREVEAVTPPEERVRLSATETVAPGGLFGTQRPEQQEGILLYGFYTLLHTLAKRDIPHTFLLYPRFARDPLYLHRKLAPIFPIAYDSLLRAHNTVVRKELVRDLKPKRPGESA